MDLPSREEARASARLPPGEKNRPAGVPVTEPALPTEPADGRPSDMTRFRLQKLGFEADSFDRRDIRNLIRAGELVESDHIRIDDGEPVAAGTVPYLRTLFGLRKTLRANRPSCCRTHTEKTAFFKCTDTGRPLCDDCAAEKKFGATTIRVCAHCGGSVADLDTAVDSKSS